MIVKFIEMTFKNILSFGANPTTIKFTEGLNNIVGKNGTGKSTILDALSFCLYGKPYRKIKLEQLINRKNKKNLLVIVKFQIDDKDIYTITRQMCPNKISIKKNDDDQELLSAKKLTQDEIDKILGINYQLFKQVISLAINYNKPFISLEAEEKRNIIEQIFNINVFGQMLKIVKKENAGIKTKLEVDSRAVKFLEENILSLNKRIKESKEAIKNFEIDKENELKEIYKNKESFVKEKEQYEKEILNLEQEKINFNFDKSKLDEIKKLKYQCEKNINENNYNIKNIDKTISFLNTPKNSICPTCKSIIDQKHKITEIDKLNKEKEKLIYENDKYNISNDNYLTQIEDMDKLENDILIIDNKISVLKNKIKITELEIDHCINQENNVIKRKIDFDINPIQLEFDEKKKEYKEIYSCIKQNNDQLKINEQIVEILSENGIKSYFFKKLIPILNDKINEYLELFELPVILEFDELMNEKIVNNENIKETVNYFSYSEGEKKRIDLAILFSFINITKLISNWNCNLLIIDELLDSAVDDYGMEKLLNSLKNMINDTNNLCIYIISHKLQQDYGSFFKKSIIMEKNSNKFSIFKISD